MNSGRFDALLGRQNLRGLKGHQLFWQPVGEGLQRLSKKHCVSGRFFCCSRLCRRPLIRNIFMTNGIIPVLCRSGISCTVIKHVYYMPFTSGFSCNHEVNTGYKGV
jgi:hypothetical protein